MARMIPPVPGKRRTTRPRASEEEAKAQIYEPGAAPSGLEEETAEAGPGPDRAAHPADPDEAHARSKPEREWPSIVGRSFLTNLKMGVSAVTEASNIAKNVLDHSISLTERLAFGKRYIDERLKAYRGQRRVAFLLPGYLQGTAAFQRMERIMESELFGVFPVVLSYQPYSQDMRKSAEKARKTIDRVLKHVEARRVYLIGHSQGGLIARYIIQVLDGHTFVSHCITLATPHLGTYAALPGGVGHGIATMLLERMGLIPRIEGESGLQMVPGSRLLSEMNHRPLPPSVVFTSIYNYVDPLVWPPSYARLPYEDAHNILLKKIGHFHALYDVQELEIILRTLLLRIKRGLIYRTRVLAGQEMLEERHMKMVGHQVDEFVAASD
ncbi:MAG: alpha/beta fold hydrolase [Nitrospirae bacterium]|nr:alpha/beta fold hydrolase [Nitrospirota bacterium]